MATKKQVQERTNRLQELGLTPDGESNYSTGSLTVTQDEIKKLKDPEWDKLIEDLVVAVNAEIPFTPSENIEQGVAVGAVIQLTFEQEVEQEVSKSISKLDVNTAKAAKFKEDYSCLSIVDFDDKKGFEAVEAAKKIVRKARTTLEAKRKEVKKYFVEVGRGIDAYAAEVNKPIDEVEAHLDAELKKYQEWKEADDKRKEEEANKKKHERVAALIAAGMVFTGIWYAIGENITMDIVTIECMSDVDFDFLLEKVKNEKIRLDKEDAEKRTAARRNRCTDIGMVINDTESAYVFANEFAALQLSVNDLVSFNDTDFNAIIFDLKEAITSAKKKVETKAEDERKKFEQEKEDLRREKLQMRQQKLEMIGLTFNVITSSYEFKNKYTEQVIVGSFVEAAENDVFNAKALEVTAIVAAAKNNQEVADKKERGLKEMKDARILQLQNAGFINFQGVLYAYPESSISIDLETVYSVASQVWDNEFSKLIAGKEKFLQDKENKRLENERQGAVAAKRLPELLACGIVEDKVTYCFDGSIVMTVDDLKTLSDGAFDTIRDAHNEAEKARLQKIEDDRLAKEKEAEELEARFQSRKKGLAVIGVFLIDGLFLFSVRENTWMGEVSPKTVRDVSVENWDQFVLDWITVIEDAQKVEHDRIAAEFFEKQKLMPELEKVKNFLDSLTKIPVPDVTEPKLMAAVAAFSGSVSHAIAELHSVLNDLL